MLHDVAKKKLKIPTKFCQSFGIDPPIHVQFIFKKRKDKKIIEGEKQIISKKNNNKVFIHPSIRPLTHMCSCYIETVKQSKLFHIFLYNIFFSTYITTLSRQKILYSV